MPDVYVYAVTYDLGFAPNPYAGLCSLACCKPNIRARAKLGDWVIGLTGTKLPPALRCVFGMVVTEAMTFEDYSAHPDHATRKPKRNGSRKKQVGDNIYRRDEADGSWLQADSIHSLEDGAQCALNTRHDTRVNRVLLSDRFVYFGETAPLVPLGILHGLGYARNARDYLKFDDVAAAGLIDWLGSYMVDHPNEALGDPIDFASASKRFSATLGKLI